MTPLSDQIVAWRPLVVLIGPTAVGKSDIAIDIARVLDTEVLTADSRQVYRGMNIATDKPSRAQQKGVGIGSLILWTRINPLIQGCIESRR